MTRTSDDEWSVDYICETYPESGHEFEKAVALLYQAEGFETIVTSGSNDDGIDIFARSQDDKRVVQVKRYKPGNKVTKSELGYLIGAAVVEGADTADIVTTSEFTNGALNLARRANLTGRLQVNTVNGSSLINRLNRNDVGLKK